MPSITEKDINKFYDELFASCESNIKKLKSLIEQQKLKDEQERLKKIQEEMLKAQKQKDEEERLKKLEEEQRQLKMEMEARRKVEEENQRKREKEEMNAKAELEAKLDKEREEKRRQDLILEQERRDHDLATRLAPEFSNGEVEPIKTQSPTKAASGQQSSSTVSIGGRKHDLSKWKYAELRDAINTSCDLELLDACREEFHRRLKVYHAWKSKNKKQGGQANGPADLIGSNSERAPSSIIASLDDVHISSEMSRPATNKKNATGKENGSEQRFFKMPFAKPADQMRDSQNPSHKKGMWYSHFDGKWIARQMEVYEDKPAVLLLAGVDDMNMCELSLEETGLTQKRGAEILENEFEALWNKNGGAKYLNDHFGQISSKYVLQIMQRNTQK